MFSRNSGLRQHAIGLAGQCVPAQMLIQTLGQVIGATFFVMEYIQGRIFRDPLLPGIDPLERAAIYDEMIRVLSALHAVDFRRVGLASFGRADGSYARRQVERWARQYQASLVPGEDASNARAVIDWLTKSNPSESASTDSIVHGDFRLENVIFHPTGVVVTRIVPSRSVAPFCDDCSLKRRQGLRAECSRSSV